MLQMACRSIFHLYFIYLYWHVGMLVYISSVYISSVTCHMASHGVTWPTQGTQTCTALLYSTACLYCMSTACHMASTCTALQCIFHLLYFIYLTCLLDMPTWHAYTWPTTTDCCHLLYMSHGSHGYCSAGGLLLSTWHAIYMYCTQTIYTSWFYVPDSALA